MLGETREAYFFKMSQSRALRRKMAKQLGLMKHGWQNIKDEFPPYNKPNNLGISEFKRSLKETSLKSSDRHKAVVQYKVRAIQARKEEIGKEK